MISPLVHGGSNTMNNNSNNINSRGQRAPVPPPRGGGNRGRVPNRGSPALKPVSEGVSRPQARSGPARTGAGPRAAVAAAYSTGQRSAAPRITADRDSCRVVHRELLASITGSADFTVALIIALNPGLSTSFPWLATQARNWERYRFNRLRFCYYTRTGSNIPGSVQLVPDYDASDSAPSSEQIASTYEDVAEDAPWKDIECFCRPSALHAMGPSKFIRSGALAANQDIKTYDSGNFFLCTLDGTGVPWGKLWVEYDVTLMTPSLPPAGSGPLSAEHLTAGANVTSGAILGTSPAKSANSDTLVAVAGNVLTFSQAGRYLVDYSVTSVTSSTQTVAPAISASGSFPGFGAPVVAGSGSTTMIQRMFVEVAIGTTLTFNNALVGAANSELWVAQLPGFIA